VGKSEDESSGRDRGSATGGFSEFSSFFWCSFMGFSMKETGQRRTKGVRKVRTESAVDVETVSGVAGERRGCAQDCSFIFWIKQNSEFGLARMRPHHYY
jgi:hypothetical protein